MHIISKYFFLIIIFNYSLISQKEFNNWYFGSYAGITFNTFNGDPKPITDGQLSSLEGCCSISDQDGNLLFYTNGQTVWNKNHEVMKNGNELHGHNASAQSSQIIQFLDIPDKYYIITTDARPGEGRNRGLCYSIVDMKKENGLGEVIEKNISIFRESTEKQYLAWNSDKTALWLITHKWNSDEFYLFKITKDGIDFNPVINKIGSYVGGNSFNSIGFIKVSPDNKKIAHTIYDIGTVDIFDFDNKTGILSNPISLTSPDFASAYGIEFSLDSKFLYLSVDNAWGYSTSKLIQFDLTQKSLEKIYNSKVILSTNTKRYGALQMAPNGKIYMANHNQNFLSVINFPDKSSFDCGFQYLGIDLQNRTCFWGLPSKPIIKAKIKDTCLIFDHEFDYKDFYFVGSASKKVNWIRLTDTRQNLSGAVWLKRKINLNSSFNIKFKFKISEGNNYNCEDISYPGADGLSLVFQNFNPYPIGSSGGGIGYDGIPNSLAIEIDLFSNDSTQIENFYDPNGNHIAIQSANNYSNSSKHSQGYLIAINPDIFQIYPETQYCCMVDYDSEKNSMKVFLDSSFKFSSPVLDIDLNLPLIINLDDNSESFIGFTSATGCATQNHDITYIEICGKSKNLLNVEINDNINDINIQPNPAKDYVRINFRNSIESKCKVSLIDMFGNEIQHLFDNYLPKDEFKLELNIDNNINSGLYFIKILVNQNISYHKCILIR